MIKIIDKNKILIEWAYRTRDGLPDPKSMSHQIILEGILREFGWNIEQRGELLKNLQEASETKPDPEKEKLMKTVIKYKDKEGEDAEITVRGALNQGEEHPAYKKAKEMLGDEDGKEKPKDGDITAEPDAFDRFAQVPLDPDDPERAAKTKKARDAVKKAAKKRKKDKKKKKDPDFKRDWEGDAVDRSGFETGTSQPTKDKKPKERAGGKGPPAKYPTQQEILDDRANGSHVQLKEDEEQRRIDRDYGNAGAGGPKASKGESMYCAVVDSYDEDAFYNDKKKGAARRKKKKENEDELVERRKKVQNRKDREETETKLKDCKKRAGRGKWKTDKECKALSDKLEGLIDEFNKKYKHLSDYPSASEAEVLDALGLDANEEPMPNEAQEYLAKREVWAEEECERLRKLPTPNVYSKASPNGFGGDNDDGSCSEAFMEWARTAYDGGLETKRLLDDAGMKEEPRTAVQSEKSTDDVMQADLENRLNVAEKALDDCHKKYDRDKWEDKCRKQQDDVDHYEVELDSFIHNREYHDTYIVGEDEDGRTMIISVSNKKGSDLKDPQNNTTPATRFRDIKEMFADDPEINGGEVAEEVAETIDSAIEQVTTAQEVSIDHSGKMDDDVGELAEEYLPDEDIISTERRKKICAQGNAKSSSKKKGNPPIKFNKWLREKADPKLSDGDWDDMCSGKNDARMLELMAQYSADIDFHKEHNATESNPTGMPSYDPFAKVFIKMGEAEKEADFLRWKKNNPNGTVEEYNKVRIVELRDTDPLTNKERALLMKLEEQEAVNEAHQSVLDKIDEADKGHTDSNGKPTRPDNPNGENGPHARGYIRSVMKALHFDKYIMMSDEATKRMIVQMGIEGVTPADFRNCLAELSGYKPPPKTDTPEGKKALIEYIEKNARLDRSLNPPAVVIGTGTPQMKLMEDTWRSAGTSQKVASGIGEDMRKCLKEKTKASRQEGKAGKK